MILVNDKQVEFTKFPDGMTIGILLKKSSLSSKMTS